MIWRFYVDVYKQSDWGWLKSCKRFVLYFAINHILGILEDLWILTDEQDFVWEQIFPWILAARGRLYSGYIAVTRDNQSINPTTEINQNNDACQAKIPSSSLLSIVYNMFLEYEIYWLHLLHQDLLKMQHFWWKSWTCNGKCHGW